MFSSFPVRLAMRVSSQWSLQTMTVVLVCVEDEYTWRVHLHPLRWKHLPDPHGSIEIPVLPWHLLVCSLITNKKVLIYSLIYIIVQVLQKNEVVIFPQMRKCLTLSNIFTLDCKQTNKIAFSNIFVWLSFIILI